MPLIAPLADDHAGRLLRDLLRSEGVELIALSAARTGLVVALVDATGERTMLSDRAQLPRGVTMRHELQRQLVGVDWVHLSGQALADVNGGDAVAAVAGGLPPSVVRSAGAGSLPTEREGVARYRERMVASRVALLIAGRDEARALVDVAGAERARPRAAADPQTLASLAATLARALSVGVIVTGGASGSAASIGELSVAVPAYAADAPVVDSTGAGDAYAAAVIGALAGRGWPPSPDALRAAMLAGSELGSRVARVTGAQGVVLGERQAAMPR